jgi:hypothetical protein
MSLEINIIITGLAVGFALFGFYQAGKHRIFEKWLQENKDKTHD